MVNTSLFSLCLVPILIWTKNSLIFRQRPFFFGFHILLDRKLIHFKLKTFFLVFTNFWYGKGCHHEIALRVPPFLATPLLLFLYAFTLSYAYLTHILRYLTHSLCLLIIAYCFIDWTNLSVFSLLLYSPQSKYSCTKPTHCN